MTNNVSVTGCGDALLSAICHYYFDNKDLSWDDSDRVVNRFVSQVISRKGATVGARTAPKELRVIPMEKHLESEKEDKEKIISILGSKNVTVFGAKIPRTEIFAFVMLIFGIVAAVIPFFLGS